MNEHTAAGTIAVVRAKLHDIRVTDADLDYQGSVTLDPDQCEASASCRWNSSRSGTRLRRAHHHLRHLGRARLALLRAQWRCGAHLSARRPGDHRCAHQRASGKAAPAAAARALFDARNQISSLLEYRVARTRPAG